MIRILFVCTANVCRSPFAERTLRSLLHESGLDDSAVIGSAGTRATPGDRVCQVADALSPPNGEHAPRPHSARPLRANLIEESDLVITMEGAHRSVVTTLAPTARHRIFTLREAADLAEITAGQGVGDVTSFAEWVRRLDAARALRSTLSLGEAAPTRESGDDDLDIADGHFARRRRHSATVTTVGRAVARLAEAMPLELVSEA